MSQISMVSQCFTCVTFTSFTRHVLKILQLGAVGPTRPSAEAGHVQHDETKCFMQKLCDLRAILAGLNASCPVAPQPLPSPGTFKCQNSEAYEHNL